MPKLTMRVKTSSVQYAEDVVELVSTALSLLQRFKDDEKVRDTVTQSRQSQHLSVYYGHRLFGKAGVYPSYYGKAKGKLYISNLGSDLIAERNRIVEEWRALCHRRFGNAPKRKPRKP